MGGEQSNGADVKPASLAARARAFAVEAHVAQRYGERPYVYHLAAVVQVLEDFGFSEVAIAAGWLHDVVEDTPATIEEIASAFGEDVAKLVWAVTGESEQRDAHSASIHKKILAHPEAASIKLADRIANLEACEAGDKHSVRYGREHAKFAEVVQPSVSSSMWERYSKALRNSGGEAV
jgi:guanosine-3',5'-bis(diphosphate) 3'-pyrophosphohydrolase